MVNHDIRDKYQYWRRHGYKAKDALRNARVERAAWDKELEVSWEWDEYYEDVHDCCNGDCCPDYRRWKAGYTDGRQHDKWWYRWRGYTKQESHQERLGEKRDTRYNSEPDCTHEVTVGFVKSPLSGETLTVIGGVVDAYRHPDYRQSVEVDLLSEALDEYDKELRDCVYYLGDPIEPNTYQEGI